MRLTWLEARDFRNHREVAVEVPPGLTAVVGPNGRGKTNLLEAIYYLCGLSSPRVSSDLPLVRAGAAAAFLRGEVQTEPGGRFLIEVEIRAGGQNRVHINRSPIRRKRDLRRHVRAVFSGPDDLRVIHGDPSERRRFMDDAVSALWPAKDTVTSRYDRVLRQRNRLLKDWGGLGMPVGLDAWDAELVAQGIGLTRARGEAVARLEHRAGAEFRTISAGTEEALVVRYRPAVDGEPLEAAFRAGLAERREDELARRTTLVGPHRDDLGLSVEGLTARGFASHGEAWGASIALRLALSRAVTREIGESPILLLDDPFSGLDPERRLRLAGHIEGRGQVLLAAPDEGQLPPGASVWQVGALAASRS